VTLPDEYFDKLMKIMTTLDIESTASHLPGVNAGIAGESKGPHRSNVTHENFRAMMRLPACDVQKVLDQLIDDHVVQRLIISGKLNAKEMKHPPLVSVAEFEFQLCGGSTGAPFNIGSSVSHSAFVLDVYLNSRLAHCTRITYSRNVFIDRDRLGLDAHHGLDSSCYK
jgi:hypothetical protein